MQGLIRADARKIPLRAETVQCVVTSPPYWGLRDYGVEGQLGLEKTPEEYVENMVKVFREVWRVLREDGTLWMNVGDTYASAWPCQRRNVVGSGSLPNGKREARPPRMPSGLKEKDLVGIPWRLAFALQADGWYLRSDIIWSKPNPMPESVKDRPTRAHEYLFLMSKSARYFYDGDAIAEFQVAPEASTPEDLNRAHNSRRAAAPARRQDRIPSGWDTGPGGHREKTGRYPDKQRGHIRLHAGFNDRWDQMEKAEQCSGTRNKRDVWTVATKPYPDAHFATFPPKLIEPCILAGSRAGDFVLDPFVGSGTTVQVAQRFQRSGVGIDLAYQDIASKREAQVELFV